MTAYATPHPLPLLTELFRRSGDDLPAPTAYSAGFFDALSAVAARPEEVMAAYYDWLRSQPGLDPTAIIEDARDLIDNWQPITEVRHGHDGN